MLVKTGRVAALRKRIDNARGVTLNHGGQIQVSLRGAEGNEESRTITQVLRFNQDDKRALGLIG